MDFFQNQDRARRRTRVLIFYYALAVTTIIILIYLGAAVLTSLPETTYSPWDPLPEAYPLWRPKLFALVAGLTIFIIVFETIWKTLELRGGGAAVAKSLGGIELAPSAHDLYERRLINIIEEMAIASGTPVPRTFLLKDERAINAFAAGYTPSNAAIGITRGSMTLLNREELQGVVAHEFSHILNGDMRLNVRLIGVLSGITAIFVIGKTLIDLLGKSSSRSSSSRSGGGPILLFGLFGLVLMVVGAVGIFFARLIKSAISRQREFLADAAAVQFTRNPVGIAGALRKIGGFSGDAALRSPRAEEASHMFFGDAIGGWLSRLSGLFSTHPPLLERIRRLEPGLSTGFIETDPDDAITVEDEDAAPVSHLSAATTAPGRIPITPAAIVSRVGSTSALHLRHAQELIGSLPVVLRSALIEPAGSAGILYALLLSRDAAVRERQLKYLSGEGLSAALPQLASIQLFAQDLDVRLRLPLIELTLPALGRLEKNLLERLSANVQALIKADGRITPFEFALGAIVRRLLRDRTSPRRVSSREISRVAPLLTDCCLALAALAYAGNITQGAAEQSFAAAARELFPDREVLMPSPGECTFEEIESALERISRATPGLRKVILSAAVCVIQHDGTIDTAEAELIRAISESIECPLPPFLPSVD